MKYMLSRTTITYATILFLMMLHAAGVSAQGENNIWTFGIGAGLNFNLGEPQFFISKSNTSEGCATICNSSGELLFYSDGLTIRDRTHAVMPNGNGILGNHGGWSTRGSATQGVAIARAIQDTNKYYVFTVDCTEAISPPHAPGYLRYAIVDMSLNGGLGDVINKNIVLDSGTSEKMIITKGAGCFYWLLVRKYSSSQFKAFKIDAQGISTDGKVSLATSFSDQDTVGQLRLYMIGEMKISPDQKLIALTTSGRGALNGIEVCDFNNATGMVSNARMIYNVADNGGNQFLYGIEFAPGGRLLYIATGRGGSQVKMNLLQQDISLLPDVNAVVNSMMRISPEGVFGGMRKGPDGKLYITGYNNTILHCINDPDKRGDSCKLAPLEFDMPDTIRTQMGFGNHVYSWNDLVRKPIYTTHDTFLCGNESSVEISAPEEYSSYTWHDGSTVQTRKINGRNIWVRSKDECREQVDTFNVYNCNECLYLPNAFSPNNDGRNDLFRALGRHIGYFEIYIYNRWGNLVYRSKDISAGWNGMQGADICDIGTYFYYVKARCSGGTDFILKGDVTLIR